MEDVPLTIPLLLPGSAGRTPADRSTRVTVVLAFRISGTRGSASVKLSSNLERRALTNRDGGLLTGDGT
jgi:hypothetical protein